MAKKMTSVDMTAMCDVAFLLLTFFILTATAKQPEALKVETPSSTFEDKLKDSDLAIISIGEKGKVFFNVKLPDVRKRTLENIGTKFGIAYTEQEKKEFSLMDGFGVPVNQLKGLLALPNEKRIIAGQQIGIPHDSTETGNELKEWIIASVAANKANNEAIGAQYTELKFAIKGDQKEQYPEIKKVMDILQKLNVNSFSLITDLKKEN
jgi:biopolymer transport protein ExbD